MAKLDSNALDQLFNKARTQNKWLAREVPDSLLHELADLMKMAPTSANCSPARIVFVKSAAAKAKLEPLLSEGNRAKTMSAPICAIVGADQEFYNHLPKLFPYAPAKTWFEGNAPHIAATAFRNSSLQGAYLIMAARALGLDTGAMSGFDNAAVDSAFFAGTAIKSNFLCNLGYGDPAGLFPRSPRFEFSEFCSIA